MADEKKEKKEAKKEKRPTALKRDLQNARQRQRNRVFKSSVKTAIRSFEEAVEKKDASVQERLNTVYSVMDRGVKRGIFKKNKADRTKSRLAARTVAAA